MLGPSVGWDASVLAVWKAWKGNSHGGLAALAGCSAQSCPSGAPWDAHGVEPGHLPNEASFPFAGSKALCSWAGGGFGVLCLGAVLGSGSKVFSSLTVSRFLFLRMVWSHIGCVAPSVRGAPAPAPVVVISPFLFLCPQASTLADGARGAGIVCCFFRVSFILSFLLALSLSPFLLQFSVSLLN